MLRSLYAMLDYHIAATDGEVGKVRDFLFDDKSWIVHYLVAEIPNALGNRKVLILPFVADRPEWETRRLPVLLTCEQIRASAPLEADIATRIRPEAARVSSEKYAGTAGVQRLYHRRRSRNR